MVIVESNNAMGKGALPPPLPQTNQRVVLGDNSDYSATSATTQINDLGILHAALQYAHPASRCFHVIRPTKRR